MKLAIQRLSGRRAAASYVSPFALRRNRGRATVGELPTSDADQYGAPVARGRATGRGAAVLKLLWHGRWLPAPDYDVPPDGVAVIVHASLPLLPVQNASGRVIPHRVRKTLKFLVTDGPRNTFVKASARLSERSYVGDYWTTLVLGETESLGLPAVALACRIPRCAGRIVAHSLLVRTLDAPWSVSQLAISAAVLQQSPVLRALGNQSYLYSGTNPPPPLVSLFRTAVATPSPAVPSATTQRQVLSPPDRSQIARPATSLQHTRPLSDATNPTCVALLGAGDYARTQIIPALKRTSFFLLAVADREPQVVSQVATRHAIPVMTTRAIDAIDALPPRGLVIVATAHDSHAALAAAALERDLMVFVEKPPVVTEHDLRLLLSRWRESPTSLDVGYNRRYHAFSRRARDFLASETGPVTIVCTVKEVALEHDHWYFWPNQGTRITGNLCHWIDLGVFLLGDSRTPVGLTVCPPVDEGKVALGDERVLSVTFDDGSVLTVIATGRGDDTLGVQERIEVRKGELTIEINDYRSLTVSRGGRTHTVRARWREKGHSTMYSEGLKRLSEARPGYGRRDLVVVSSIQIAATEFTHRLRTSTEAEALLRELSALHV